MERGGLDPILLDRRPLHQILNDEIPYAKWDRQLYLIKRAGYPTVIDWLKAHAQARQNRRNKA